MKFTISFLLTLIIILSMVSSNRIVLGTGNDQINNDSAEDDQEMNSSNNLGRRNMALNRILKSGNNFGVVKYRRRNLFWKDIKEGLVDGYEYAVATGDKIYQTGRDWVEKGVCFVSSTAVKLYEKSIKLGVDLYESAKEFTAVVFASGPGFIFDGLEAAFNELGEIMADVSTALDDLGLGGVADFISGAVDFVAGAIEEMGDLVGDICDKFQECIGDVKQCAKDIVEDLSKFAKCMADVEIIQDFPCSEDIKESAAVCLDSSTKCVVQFGGRSDEECLVIDEEIDTSRTEEFSDGSGKIVVDGKVNVKIETQVTVDFSDILMSVKILKKDYSIVDYNPTVTLSMQQSTENKMKERKFKVGGKLDIHKKVHMAGIVPIFVHAFIQPVVFVTIDGKMEANAELSMDLESNIKLQKDIEVLLYKTKNFMSATTEGFELSNFDGTFDVSNINYTGHAESQVNIIVSAGVEITLLIEGITIMVTPVFGVQTTFHANVDADNESCSVDVRGDMAWGPNIAWKLDFGYGNNNQARRNLSTGENTRTSLIDLFKANCEEFTEEIKAAIPAGEMTACFEDLANDSTGVDVNTTLKQCKLWAETFVIYGWDISFIFELDLFNYNWNWPDPFTTGFPWDGKKNIFQTSTDCTVNNDDSDDIFTNEYKNKSGSCFEPYKENVLLCNDGTTCNPFEDGHEDKWQCCLYSHGGRHACPSSKPYMCNRVNCSGEHCCKAVASGCADEGGVRKCVTDVAEDRHEKIMSENYILSGTGICKTEDSYITNKSECELAAKVLKLPSTSAFEEVTYGGGRAGQNSEYRTDFSVKQDGKSHPQGCYYYMTSDTRKKQQETGLFFNNDIDDLFPEPETVTVDIDRWSFEFESTVETYVDAHEPTTVPGAYSVCRVSGGLGKCWDGNSENKMLCMNDEQCDPFDEGWSCCKNKGGRKACPSTKPYMCNGLGCNGEHCCTDSESWCTLGLRKCSGQIVPYVKAQGPGCIEHADFIRSRAECEYVANNFGFDTVHAAKAVDAPPLGCYIFTQPSTGSDAAYFWSELLDETASQTTIDLDYAEIMYEKIGTNQGYSLCKRTHGIESCFRANSNNKLVCNNGSECMDGWDCCSKKNRGGRKACPSNSPFMCERISNDCNNDFCCFQNLSKCDQYGGPRKCPSSEVRYNRYNYIQKSTSGCESKQHVIDDIEECKYAAYHLHSLIIAAGVEEQNFSTFPKGCYTYTNSDTGTLAVKFNTQGEYNTNNEVSSICYDTPHGTIQKDKWLGRCYAPTKNSMMLCQDGSLCDPYLSVGDSSSNWGCCTDKGGRKACPADAPYMCENKTCSDNTENCCSINISHCDDKGGLRKCPTEKEGTCWKSNSGVLSCNDGTTCDPSTDENEWKCCYERGGRRGCPKSSPYMCANRECDDDHCCFKDKLECNRQGGVRKCPTMTRESKMLSPHSGDLDSNDQNKLLCMNDTECDIYIMQNEGTAYEYAVPNWHCCGNIGGRKACPSSSPYMCAIKSSDCSDDYCCQNEKDECDAYGGLRKVLIQDYFNKEYYYFPKEPSKIMNENDGTLDARTYSCFDDSHVINSKQECGFIARSLSLDMETVSGVSSNLYYPAGCYKENGKIFWRKYGGELNHTEDRPAVCRNYRGCPKGTIDVGEKSISHGTKQCECENNRSIKMHFGIPDDTAADICNSEVGKVKNPAECRCKGGNDTGGMCSDEDSWCYLDFGLGAKYCPGAQLSSAGDKYWSYDICECKCTGGSDFGGSCSGWDSDGVWCYLAFELSAEHCPGAIISMSGDKYWSNDVCATE